MKQPVTYPLCRVVKRLGRRCHLRLGGLEHLKEQGKTPDKPFKGTFNVRTGPELHRKAAMIAQRKKTGLNRVVVEALEQYLARESSEPGAS